MLTFQPNLDRFPVEAFNGFRDAQRTVLQRIGLSPDLEPASLTLPQQIDFAVKFLHIAFNELNHAPLDDAKKARIRQDLHREHLRLAVGIQFALVLRDLGLPPQTALPELTQAQKKEFVGRLNTTLLDCGRPLVGELRRQYEADLGNVMRRFQENLFKVPAPVSTLPHGVPRYGPGGNITPPLTNIWDFLLSCLPFSGCEREKNEKTGEITYTYRDGSKKVIGKDGAWTEYDKNGDVTRTGTGDMFESWAQPWVDFYDKWSPYIKFVSFVLKALATLGVIPPILGFLTWTDLASLVYDGYSAETDSAKSFG